MTERKDSIGSADNELSSAEEEDGITSVSTESADEEKSSVEEESGAQPQEVLDEHLYGPAARERAINNLLFYSIVMFCVPLTSMYCLQRFFFRDYLSLDSSTSTLYAGGVAVLMVYAVVMLFIRAAYNEEKRDEALIKESLKSE